MPKLLRAVVLLLGAAIASVDAAGAPSPHLPAIRRLLAKNYKKTGPGAAVLVMRNGVVELEAFYGLADVENRRPIDARSVFDLASLSKQFTATAALLLIADGKLSLDAPVAEVLPGYRVKKRRRDVTVGDLIHHTSGLRDYSSDDWDGSDEEFRLLTNDGHLRWLSRTRPRRAPGVKWEYNNSNYALLASVIEEVSGMPFAQFARTRLFTPAGMNATVVHDRIDLHERIPNLVRGYDGADDSSNWTQIAGDGNVLTTIGDLARWERRLRTLPKRAWTTGRLDNGKPLDAGGYGYAFGWYVDDGSVFHSGSWDGTATYMSRSLDGGVTVIVLSNDESSDVAAIATEIEAIVEGGDD
ncbi:MAG TPA: serine hydrolase domain-containing protein [Thermoanaerobaculia bacterium]|nr:serine hydrolase domain-containing protein [Thermoanaerobaculia bacterium]